MIYNSPWWPKTPWKEINIVISSECLSRAYLKRIGGSRGGTRGSATLIFRPNWGEKNPYPLSQGLDDRTLPLSEGLDPPLKRTKRWVLLGCLLNPTKPCTCLFLVLHVPFSFAVFVVVNEMVIRCNVMTFFKGNTCEKTLLTINAYM